MTRKHELPYFYFLMGFLSLSLNLVHPVTPKFFEFVGYPDYMFGLAFALMSLGSFLLSPMWSKLAQKFGYKKIMALGVGLYGVGQLLFSISRTIPLTSFARLFSGIFSAGVNVAITLYLSNNFGREKKGERMALGSAISVSSGALGYFFGGFIGNQNTLLAFYLQSAFCFLLAGLFFFSLKNNIEDGQEIKIHLSDINPFKAFLDVKRVMTQNILLFYLLTVLLSFAFVSFESTFNYFIRKIFQLQPIYNGIIKGSVGILGLLLNVSLNRWIAVKFNPKKSIQVFNILIILTLVALVSIESVAPFIAAALLYYTLDAMLKPLMQIIGTESPIIFGGYNSMVSLGMVSGSFSAGYLFTINPKLPFYFSLGFAIVALYIGRIFIKTKHSK